MDVNQDTLCFCLEKKGLFTVYLQKQELYM